MTLKVKLEDRAEIEELIARYSWALDTGDFEGYADCFTEDGWLRHWPQGLCEGREGLKRATDSLWYSKPNHYLGRQHRFSSIIMKPEQPNKGRDAVRIKAFWSILQHDVETFENRIFGMGTWDTQAVRCEDGDWRCFSVDVDLWIGGQVPWVGEDRAWKNGPPVESVQVAE